MPADAKDVVEAHKAAVTAWYDDDSEDDYPSFVAVLDAGDAICAEVKRLRLANQRLREALRPFAELPDGILEPHPCLARCWRIGESSSLDERGRCVECGAHTRGADETLDSPSPTFGEIRAARAALKGSEKE